LTPDLGEVVRVDEMTTLHHVEIPLTHQDATYHYAVGSGDQGSTVATFKAYPTDVLRVAIVANWQGKPELSAIVNDDVHLLATAGDNIASIWQSCHAFDAESEQFRWYEALTRAPVPFTVTLYNERNVDVRTQADHRWHQLLRRGTCAISGFGYFAEHAEVDGFAYYNTALNGRGDRYPDPHSDFLAGENGYVLLTVPRGGPMTVEIKSLTGDVMDRRAYDGRE